MQFIKLPQAPQHRDELRRLPDLLAQLPRPGVDLPHFRGGKTLSGPQRHTQRGVQREFVLRALGGVRQRREDFQPCGQMPNRFQVGRALDGPLARPLPIGDGLRQQRRPRV